MGWRDKITPKRAYREALIICIVFGLFGFALILSSFKNLCYPETKKDFIRFSSSLTASPFIEKSKNSSRLRFELYRNGQTDFIRFFVSDWERIEHIDEFLSMKQYDTLSILIDKTTYQTNEQLSGPTTYYDPDQREQIEVCAIKTNKFTFMSLEKYLQNSKENSLVRLVVGILFIPCVYFAHRYEYKYTISENRIKYKLI